MAVVESGLVAFQYPPCKMCGDPALGEKMRFRIDPATFNRLMTYAFWTLIVVIITIAIFAPEVLSGTPGEDSRVGIQNDAR